MRRKMIIYLVLFLFSHSLLAQKTCVTFVGNSITFVTQIGNLSVNSYPVQLQNLLGEDYQVNNLGVSLTSILKKENDVKKTNFYGFLCIEFEYEGRKCKIAKPRRTAIGHPWIWRARFWGHEPQVDIALLEQGYHVVYCDTKGLMGNAESIAAWNSFYNLLVKVGLYKKCVLEGMSRGAMYALNWAAENPDKVEAVYIDNPLLDVRYLAYRPKHLEAMTQDLLKAYNLKDRRDLSNFDGSPLDKTEAIAKGNYPIFILSADEDEAVDHQQALDFKEKVEQAGGHVSLIIKKGFKHHPHCLPNPTSIIDFILDAKKVSKQ